MSVYKELSGSKTASACCIEAPPIPKPATLPIRQRPSFLKTAMVKATLSYERKSARLRYSRTWNIKARIQLARKNRREEVASTASAFLRGFILPKVPKAWERNSHPAADRMSRPG